MEVIDVHLFYQGYLETIFNVAISAVLKILTVDCTKQWIVASR